jgi:hypothetical protein
MARRAKPGAATQSGASSSGSPDGATPTSQAVMNPMFLRQMQVCLRCGGFRFLPRTASISSRALCWVFCLVVETSPRVCVFLVLCRHSQKNVRKLLTWMTMASLG